MLKNVGVNNNLWITVSKENIKFADSNLTRRNTVMHNNLVAESAENDMEAKLIRPILGEIPQNIGKAAPTARLPNQTLG